MRININSESESKNSNEWNLGSHILGNVSKSHQFLVTVFLYGQGGSIPAAPQQVTVHRTTILLLYNATVIHKNVTDQMKIDIIVKYGR